MLNVLRLGTWNAALSSIALASGVAAQGLMNVIATGTILTKHCWSQRTPCTPLRLVIVGIRGIHGYQ